MFIESMTHLELDLEDSLQVRPAKLFNTLSYRFEIMRFFPEIVYMSH